MATPFPPPRRKKVAAPCWTHDETLSLIDAYRDRWYSLGRGYLRLPDWEAVAALVRHHHDHDHDHLLLSLPKTSVQCRHKMEKLRQRYRAEKNRSVSCPDRFFSSSWVFFSHMDSMENGPSSAVGSDTVMIPRRGFCSETLIDGNSVSGSYRYVNGNGEFNPNFDLDHDSVCGYPAKPFGASDLVTVASGRKKFRKIDGSSSANDTQIGFLRNTLVGRNVVPLVFKSKNFGVTDDGNYNPDGNFDHDAKEDDVVTPINRKQVVPDFSSRNHQKIDTHYCKPKSHSRTSNGCSSAAVGGGETSPIAEMVSAIKSLGEGFVKVEKMKMDMVREMEKMRMEMEMKRFEMLVESHRQIVDAFVSGALDNKREMKDEVD